MAVGRGFRAANLPERFYHGITPDGGGYQVRNHDLKPETSFNLDLGFRFRWKGFYWESTYFYNLIRDGIQIQPLNTLIFGLPAYKNVNMEKIRFQGVESLVQWQLPFNCSFSLNFSYLQSKNLTNPELMYADTYGSRLNFKFRYIHPRNYFSLEYHWRYNGPQKEVNFGNNPVGDVLPRFAVHSLRVKINLFQGKIYSQRLTMVVGNFTNALYAEFSNATFFRPAARRHIILSWGWIF